MRALTTLWKSNIGVVSGVIGATESKSEESERFHFLLIPLMNPSLTINWTPDSRSRKQINYFFRYCLRLRHCLVFIWSRNQNAAFTPTPTPSLVKTSLNERLFSPQLNLQDDWIRGINVLAVGSGQTIYEDSLKKLVKKPIKDFFTTNENTPKNVTARIRELAERKCA